MQKQPYSDSLQVLGLETLADRHLVCKIIWAIIEAGGYEFVLQSLGMKKSIRGPLNNELNIATFKTEVRKPSFHILGATLENSIPAGVRSLLTLKWFKRALLSLDNYNLIWPLLVSIVYCICVFIFLGLLLHVYV